MLCQLDLTVSVTLEGCISEVEGKSHLFLRKTISKCSNDENLMVALFEKVCVYRGIVICTFRFKFRKILKKSHK
jgi:hypothetical protein